MKPSLQVALGQQLRLTPQLRQAIHLLQLSGAELEQEIADAVESNPLLDWDETPPEPQPDARDTDGGEGPHAAADDRDVEWDGGAQVELPEQVVLQRFAGGRGLPGGVVVGEAARGAGVPPVAVPALGLGGRLLESVRRLRRGAGVLGRVDRRLVPVEQGVGLDRRRDFLFEFRARELEQVDRLAQLRGEPELLAERDLEAGPGCHVGATGGTPRPGRRGARRDSRAGCPVRPAPARRPR